jgi:hypothetical protein
LIQSANHNKIQKNIGHALSKEISFQNILTGSTSISSILVILSSSSAHSTIGLVFSISLSSSGKHSSSHFLVAYLSNRATVLL